MLSIFDKIIERLMYSRLIKFLLKYKVINKYKFGFRKGHSTTLALIEVMDEIYENLDKNNHVMGIFFGIYKKRSIQFLIRYCWTNYMHMG